MVAGSSNWHAALWENGVVTDLGSFGGNGARARGINNQSQIVGDISWSQISATAFLWEDGVMTDLGNLGAAYATTAFDINDWGQIVGTSTISKTPFEAGAFLWENDAMTDLGSLGGQDISIAFAINNQSQVVGVSNYARDEPAQPVLWQDGTIENLGNLGGGEGWAYGINDQGQIVGQSRTGDSTHAFIWENGVMVDLNNLIEGESDWELIQAWDINNNGWIIGTGRINGEYHVFLLTPIPTIDAIIAFINGHANIVGVGPGNSANNKYNAFMNMLNTAADLIEADHNEGTCGLLNSIIDKCDGLPNPPDFIDGNAETMGTLIGMLDDLNASLGCE